METTHSISLTIKVRLKATPFPLADANGNIVTYSDNAGNVQAHYEYGAFGGTVSSSGDMDGDFRFRFSSKYLDDETGLYYYGYRWYSPVLGRWVSRDPIGELVFFRKYVHTYVNSYEGFLRLHAQSILPSLGFVSNSPISSYDVLGLDIILTTGNKNASWWQIGNRFLHQEICVDTWVFDPENPCCKKKGPRECYSFAAIPRVGFNFGPRWLGRKSWQFGGPLVGEVYWTGDQGRKDTKTLKTTCEQDQEFRDKLLELDYERAIYSVGRHNCRKFSQMMFEEAEDEYSNDKDDSNAECECNVGIPKSPPMN